MQGLQSRPSAVVLIVRRASDVGCVTLSSVLSLVKVFTLSQFLAFSRLRFQSPLFL
jgi:hypothetical protein